MAAVIGSGIGGTKLGCIDGCWVFGVNSVVVLLGCEGTLRCSRDAGVGITNGELVLLNSDCCSAAAL